MKLSGSSPLNILLVDDREENLQVLEAVLSSPEYRLTQVRSGAEAIEAVSKQEFFVVLLDIQMPVMDGFETARRIRATLKGKDAPIVFVAALDRHSQCAHEGYELGAVDYVFKPFEPLALRAKINLFADLYRKNQEMARLAYELGRSRAILDSVIDNLPTMVFVKEAEGLRYVRFNRAGEELIGRPRCELIGRTDQELFPRNQADFYTANDRVALEGDGRSLTFEEMCEDGLGGIRYLRTRKLPVFGLDGHPEYLLGISEDITEFKLAEAERIRSAREQAALEERERVARQTAFLAEASTLIASSLDYRQTFRRLATLAVDSIADWCTVTVMREDGMMERLAAAHRDPSKAFLLDELNQHYPDNACADSSMGQVIRTGKALIVPEVKDDFLVEYARDERHLRLMRELGCRSSMLIPLNVRGKAHGAICFVSAEAERIYGVHEVGIAEELGRRGAIAIDNALLYEAAQRAIGTRDEFISIASHELKTPLTSLDLQLQFAREYIAPALGEGTATRDLVAALDTSLSQVSRLATLIEQLLDTTRIQAGKMQLTLEPLDLVALVRESVDRYQKPLKRAGCAVRVLSVEPVWVSGDRFRLEQVIINLLSNAAKYGAGKPVEVAISTQPSGSILLTCRDFGIGIAEDKLEKIFERFERVVDSKAIGGLGLGLYIVRDILRSHQGTIRVESQVGEGSVFSIELPALEVPLVSVASIQGGAQKQFESSSLMIS